jgi:hypothetical protein
MIASSDLAEEPGLRVFQSRVTVSGETFKTSAVSSMLRPPNDGSTEMAWPRFERWPLVLFCSFVCSVPSFRSSFFVRRSALRF